MVEQSLDAIATQRALVRGAEVQLASKRAANKAAWPDLIRLSDSGCDALKKQVTEAKQAFAASVADFATKGYGDLPAGLGNRPAQELQDMPLASTDTTCESYAPSTADSSGIRGINLQRVIGYHCIHEARSSAAGNTAAATAAEAKLNEALAVYARRVVEVTPALARQILSDVSSYEAVMVACKQIAPEVEGLVRIAAAGAKFPQMVPGTGEQITMATAEALVNSSAPDAPGAGSPARALYARHRATSASISLYEQLCALTAVLGCSSQTTVVPGAVKALAR